MAFLATGLAALLASGCGSEDEPACRGQFVMTRGCVDLMNFSTVEAVISIAGAGGTATVPAATNQGTMPGTSWAQVSPNLDSQTTFELRENGSVVRSVTCTVGPDAWVDLNPSLVVQNSRALSCENW
jgi:hypothetical protein